MAQGIVYVGEHRLNRFEILDLIGQGGEAVVAQARDWATGHEVALKIIELSDTPAARNRRVSTLRAIGDLRIGHPCVLDPIEYIETGKEFYLVMPLLQGVNLGTLLRKKGPFSSDKTSVIVTQVLDAIDALHRRGVVHRDIKASNIIIEHQDWPIVIDLTIAQVPGIGDCEPAGTPGSSAPEQFIDPPSCSRASDLYAVGVLTVLLLTGEPPEMQLPDGSVRLRQPGELFRILKSMNCASPQLIALTEQVLRHRPEARPQSVSEVRELLQGRQSCVVGFRDCSFCRKKLAPGARFCCCCGAQVGQVHSGTRCLACGAAQNGITACQSCQRPHEQSGMSVQFVEGVLRGQEFTFVLGDYEVGRCQLAPSITTISRRQFGIACQGTCVSITALSSINPVHVEGQRLRGSTLLHPGMVVSFAGNTGIIRKEK